MQNESPTIDWIITVEPRVGTVMDKAQHARRRTWRTSERLKGKLDKLVGYNADRPELRTSEAYEIALRAMSAALYQQKPKTLKTGDRVGMG